MKKSASISIDLRQSSLVRVVDESSKHPPSKSPSIKPNEQANHANKYSSIHQFPRKEMVQTERIEETRVASEEEPKQPDAPTTVIHLKMVSPNRDDVAATESKDSTIDDLSRENKISDVKKLMDDMRKEKLITHKKLENERIKEFEINKQLERLKYETKRNVKKHAKSLLNSHSNSPKNEESRDFHSNDNEYLIINNNNSQLKNNLKSCRPNNKRDETNGSAMHADDNPPTLTNYLQKGIQKTQYKEHSTNEKINKHLKKDQIDQLISHLTSNDSTLCVKNNFKNGDKTHHHKNGSSNNIKTIESNNIRENTPESDENTTERNHQTTTTTSPLISPSASRHHWLRGPASYKRRCLSNRGPLSKRIKLLSQHGVEVAGSCRPNEEGHKWLLIHTPGQQHYHQGQHIYKDLPEGWQAPKESVRVCVCNGEEGDEDEDERYSQIGNEVLRLGNLSTEDINELKKQVREEQRHKENENIMPILLNMSWEQIESSYKRGSHHGGDDGEGGGDDQLPDITSGGGEDESEGCGWEVSRMDDAGMRGGKIEADEEEEEDEEEEGEKDDAENEDEDEDVEFKSLDALYQEELNKSGYRRWLEQLENDPYQLDHSNFWQENNYDYKHLKDGVYYDSEPVTDYSKSRPKRSTVDYTPAAFTVIRYMEGGRPCRKPPSCKRGRGDVAGGGGGGVSSNESLMSDEGGKRKKKKGRRSVDEEGSDDDMSGCGRDDDEGGGGDAGDDGGDVVCNESNQLGHALNGGNISNLKACNINDTRPPVGECDDDDDDDGDDDDGGGNGSDGGGGGKKNGNACEGDNSSKDFIVNDNKSVNSDDKGFMTELTNAKTADVALKPGFEYFKYDDDDEEEDDDDAKERNDDDEGDDDDAKERNDDDDDGSGDGQKRT